MSNETDPPASMPSVFNGAMDLSGIAKAGLAQQLVQPPKQKLAVGIRFRRELEDGTIELMEAVVKDKYPQMADVHVEGRRVVELSIEQYMDIVTQLGWVPIQPGQEN